MPTFPKCEGILALPKVLQPQKKSDWNGHDFIPPFHMLYPYKDCSSYHICMHIYNAQRSILPASVGRGFRGATAVVALLCLPFLKTAVAGKAIIQSIMITSFYSPVTWSHLKGGTQQQCYVKRTRSSIKMTGCVR